MITAVPVDIDRFEPLPADYIARRVFRCGAVKPAGVRLGRDIDGTVYIHGHDLADEDAIRYARTFYRQLVTTETPRVYRVAMLFTRDPFDGRTRPEGATWCSTEVDPATPGAVDVTLIFGKDPT